MRIKNFIKKFTPRGKILLEHTKFKRNNYDRTLRLDYDLNEDSIVFDVGGHLGDWASNIYAKYNCWVHVFEPIKEYHEFIGKRFIKNKKIVVHPFGLAGSNEQKELALLADSSTTFFVNNPFTKIPGNTKRELIKLGRVSEITKQFKEIDLMKLNIEGGEYDLIDDLIDTGEIKKIKNLQVQFHNCYKDAKQRMAEIQQKLSLTHSLTYSFWFTWENWQLK